MGSKDVNINSRIFRNPKYLSSSIDNEVVILNIDKGEYNGLDEIGSDIWNRLESPQVVSDLVSSLMEIYNVDKKQCAADVIEFITELEKTGLIHIENEDQ